MILSNQWVPLSELSFDGLEPLTSEIEKRCGSGGMHYIFRNQDEQITQGMEHYARLEVSDDIPRKLRNLFLNENYDLVFLYIKKKPTMKYHIIKHVQENSELDISRRMGKKSVGPLFEKSFKSPYKGKNEIYIVEEFLSPTQGWNPAYLQQKTIRKHYALCIGSFGEIMSTMHRNNIIYNDKLWKHLFFNSIDNECLLVDFGHSFESYDQNDIRKELDHIYNFIYKMFPEKDQEIKRLLNQSYFD